MKKLMVWLSASVFVMAIGGVVCAQTPKPKPLELKDLPPAVQKTVTANLKTGMIKSISKETEDGIEQYEIETTFNGRARDFNVDINGKLLVLEEATSIDQVPAAAKAAILQAVGTGKLGTVETINKPGQPMAYEAAYKDKAGKSHSVVVDAAGKAVKS